MKISRQLQFGLGIILVFVVLLGAVAWFDADSLWQQTKGLYEHPLQVRRAVGEIKANVLSMHRGMKDLVLADNVQEIQVILQSIDTTEANTYQQFDILYDRYLGPRSDIDDAIKAFVEWKAIREETIRLLQTGETAEALSRTKSTGDGGTHVDKMLGYVQTVSDFAINKGDQFYLDAQKQREGLMVKLAAILGAILLVSLGISYFLLKGITDPLKELTLVTQQYRKGKLDSRSRYVSTNEFGVLAASYNALADTVQAEIRSKEDTARIADVMLRKEEMHTFCQELLKALLENTGSQVGGVYLLNEQRTAYEHFESIGLSPDGRRPFSAAQFEGEFGAALATRQIQRIEQIPADTHFTFSAVSGDFKPREIITIPVLSEHHIVALVSLASIHSYSESAVRLVNDVWGVLTARLNGVLAFRQIRAFSEKLEGQNRELAEQANELSIQADELSEQNIELELQKKQLNEANRLKSAFLSNMSHELRTPLNSVIALSGVLNRRLRNSIPEDEYSYIEVIERNGKQLLALINDILDLSRIEAGREEISLSHFSARDLAGEVVALIEPQAHEKNISLLNRVSADLPVITSDFAKGCHILQNIVGNAVKFTEEGSVEISAARVGDAIQIVVADTGIGIAADQLPYIFDEFRQADESTSRKYGGTGLGLAIARKYAIMLRGKIAVESIQGKGSIFTLTLPLSGAPLTPNTPVAGTEKHFIEAETSRHLWVPAGQGKCVLLVEDSQPAVIQLTDILSEQGYRVQVAHNGREALEQIQQAPPDAVILDLMMPEVDGFQVLRMVRGEKKTAQLPVLILTAKHVSHEELSLLKGNNIYQLIQKGDINKKDLLAAVGKMVAPGQEKRSSPEQTIPRVRASGPPVVLIVEDNPDNRKTVQALLNDDCTVLEASDGQAGVELARNHKPDLILLDISLPVLDGFQVLAAMKSDETIRHIPVLALTARAMKGDREEILAYGFDGYISKPIDAGSFLKTIREIIDAG